MSRNKILVVEDELKIAEAIEAYLNKSGYATIVAFDGQQALKLLNEHPDMVVLDLMLPYISGEELCRIIRRQSKIPIIMLTAKATEDSKIAGLDMGADDYITKPFSPRELVARVNSLFRRCGTSKTLNLNSGDLEIDLSAYIVKKHDKALNLTPNEFKILSTLAKYPNKTFTRDELIEAAFGMDFVGYDRTIDSHIKNLRSKIETDSAAPTYIITVRGVGYKFGGVVR